MNNWSSPDTKHNLLHPPFYSWSALLIMWPFFSWISSFCPDARNKDNSSVGSYDSPGNNLPMCASNLGQADCRTVGDYMINGTDGKCLRTLLFNANSLFLKWYAIVICIFFIAQNPWRFLSGYIIYLQYFCKKNKLSRMTTYFSYPRIKVYSTLFLDMFITVNDYELCCLIRTHSFSNGTLYSNGLSVFLGNAFCPGESSRFFF